MQKKWLEERDELRKMISTQGSIDIRWNIYLHQTDLLTRKKLRCEWFLKRIVPQLEGGLKLYECG